ncbi:MAG: low affinity iron permease family protein [Dokdonella sp.]
MTVQKIRLNGTHSIFDRFAGKVTQYAGSPWAFAVSLLAIAAWATTGPIFHYSDDWQMVVNTGTTIITFLMVFLIQQSQNKDSLAVHIKLNELLAAHEFASNRVVAIETLDEADLAILRKFYCQLATDAEKDGGIKKSHSLDDAGEVTARKAKIRKPSTRAAKTQSAA